MQTKLPASSRPMRTNQTHEMGVRRGTSANRLISCGHTKYRPTMAMPNRISRRHKADR